MKKAEETAVSNTRRKIAEIMNKEGNKLVFGYRPTAVDADKKEGDVWEDVNGKKWTIKNGIKQSISKLDTAKTPYWCPKCTKPLNHKHDLKFWRIRGHCMDCNIKEEMEIRNRGEWQQYEQKLMLGNFIAEIKDKIAELQSYHDSFSKPEFLLMDEQEKRVLMMETWNVDEDKVKEDLRKDIDTLNKLLQETIEKYESGESNEPKVEEVSRRDEVNS